MQFLTSACTKTNRGQSTVIVFNITRLNGIYLITYYHQLDKNNGTGLCRRIKAEYKYHKSYRRAAAKLNLFWFGGCLLDNKYLFLFQYFINLLYKWNDIDVECCDTFVVVVVSAWYMLHGETIYMDWNYITFNI